MTWRQKSTYNMREPAVSDQLRHNTTSERQTLTYNVTVCHGMNGVNFSSVYLLKKGGQSALASVIKN